MSKSYLHKLYTWQKGSSGVPTVLLEIQKRWVALTFRSKAQMSGGKVIDFFPLLQPLYCATRHNTWPPVAKLKYTRLWAALDPQLWWVYYYHTVDFSSLWHVTISELTMNSRRRNAGGHVDVDVFPVWMHDGVVRGKIVVYSMRCVCVKDSRQEATNKEVNCETFHS